MIHQEILQKYERQLITTEESGFEEKNARKFLFDFFKKEKYNTDKRVADQRKSSFATRFVCTCCRTL